MIYSVNPALYSSSESEDSEDEQSCYRAEQARAKRRASSRVSFSLNSELSRAVSKYSDDESSAGVNETNENIDCKLSSCQGSKFLPISEATSCAGAKKIVSDLDRESRSRCFEYLVGAIDEAWARYCNATTSVEDEVYGYDTPVSVVTDDDDYFDNSTDFTDYDSDFGLADGKTTTSTSKGAVSSGKASIDSKDESSHQLQALKDRLTKAKYFLQDLVDSDDFNEVTSFWKRWDMIKYATIELVEDDDDDEIVESTIEELEEGRLFLK